LPLQPGDRGFDTGVLCLRVEFVVFDGDRPRGHKVCAQQFGQGSLFHSVACRSELFWWLAQHVVERLPQGRALLVGFGLYLGLVEILRERNRRILGAGDSQQTRTYRREGDDSVMNVSARPHKGPDSVNHTASSDYTTLGRLAIERSPVDAPALRGNMLTAPWWRGGLMKARGARGMTALFGPPIAERLSDATPSECGSDVKLARRIIERPRQLAEIARMS
jgi:hypothetical protein